MINETRSSPFRLILVDEHVLVRQVLKMIIESDERFLVVGDFACVAEALSMCESEGEGVELVVIDATSANHQGLWLVRELNRRCPNLPVMLFSHHTDLATVREAISAGACGCVSKKITRSNLLAAFEHLLAGGKFIQPILRNALLPFDPLLPVVHN